MSAASAPQTSPTVLELCHSRSPEPASAAQARYQFRSQRSAKRVSEYLALGRCTVGGTGRFDIRGGTPVLNLNGHTLTKIGTNQFSIVGAAVNSGNIVVNQGTLSIETATSIDNTVPTDTITVNTGATLQFFANSRNREPANRD